jgi:hypothetical protein
MQIARWFKVLVISGASLVTVACTEMKTEPEGRAEPPDSGPDSDSGQMHAVITDTGSVLDAGSSQDSGGQPDASTTHDATAPDATMPDSGPMVMCSMTPTPSDPCGCPCCWAVGYLNTDPQCDGFCSLGNNGMGCCQ